MINHDNHYKSASYPSTFFLQIKIAPFLTSKVLTSRFLVKQSPIYSYPNPRFFPNHNSSDDCGKKTEAQNYH